MTLQQPRSTVSAAPPEWDTRPLDPRRPEIVSDRDLYWDDLCCAGNSDDAHRHGIEIGRAAPAQPLPTEPDWGRMAYVLGLIGPVDTDDTEDAFVAYAEDIRAHYRRSDLETDSQYAAYVSRLSEARDE